eukprot:6760511-Pyramimonas_sp.AAC.1
MTSGNGSRALALETVLVRLESHALRQLLRPRPNSTTQSLLEKGNFCPRILSSLILRRPLRGFPETKRRARSRRRKGDAWERSCRPTQSARPAIKRTLRRRFH